MSRPKIGVIGAGYVGATTAQRLAERELGDVVMIDIVEGLPQGKGLDMAESAPIEGFDAHVVGSNDYAPLKGASVVVITAGLPRKPGMDRSDLLKVNGQIMKSVVQGIQSAAPSAILVVVSNPLDVMCFVAHKLAKLPKQKVVGMAGVLDSARFRYFIAEELKVSVKDVQAMVLGGHGDSMVPLPSYSSVSGIPVRALMSEARLNALIERTRHGGAEIVNLLKTGSAYYAPSSSAVDMVESIVRNQRRLLPCCCLLSGEYGIDKTWVGVPAVLGTQGVEQILEVPLTDAERAALKTSAAGVAEGQRMVAELIGL